MRVSVFGLGKVGTVTAACLARAGHDVVGVDVDPGVVAALRAGGVSGGEPDLGPLLSEMLVVDLDRGDARAWWAGRRDA